MARPMPYIARDRAATARGATKRRRRRRANAKKTMNPKKRGPEPEE
jgi:hypothetical protein